MGVAVDAVNGLFGLGVGVQQAREERRAQKANLNAQERAQREAVSRAAALQRAQARERRNLNRRKPDVNNILRNEVNARTSGSGATTLTGASGVRPSALTLGGTKSLLGG